MAGFGTPGLVNASALEDLTLNVLPNMSLITKYGYDKEYCQKCDDGDDDVSVLADLYPQCPTQYVFDYQVWL